ncbi:protein dispatched [Neocloeon triangulifer]|uniref:protein dispatched n=1 Tax=Neocloeon triangulifer TaxID=2078957 RepID=UPI00286F29F7|nr:protein dispatched [Neocloeon triangulifer]
MENNAGANPNNNITSGQKFHLNFSSSSAIFLLWLTLTGISIAAIVIILVQPSHSPDFSNPHMGFETKSTLLSGRNDVLVNLAEASKPYGFMTSNPEGKRLQILQGRMHRQKLESWQHTLFKESKVDSLNDLPKVHTHSVFVNSNSTVLDQVPSSLPPNLKQEHQNSSHFIFPSDSSLIQSDASITSDGDVGHVTMVDYDEDEDGHYGEAHNHSHVNKDSFCGQPTWSHARLIISNKKEGENLWKLDVVKELCSLEKEIEPLYTEICETQTPQNCCPMWSLTRYLLLASNKSSCEELQEDDLLNCADLLQECTHHFHNLDLECIEEEGTCQLAPNRCTRKSIVRGLMNFIFDIGFLPPNSSDQNEHVLKFIQIILPIAKSTKSYDFYKRLQALSLSHYKQIKIVAMDLGLEDYIFDKLLIHDSIRISMIISALILIILLLFIRSFLMIFFGLLNIVLSLAISYWLYCETLGADRFPFLNLMAALLLLAIGTDDLLFIAHSWQDYHDLKLKDKLWSLTPLWFSVTATSLTTAAAMFAARLSSVTSIALFSIFAGSTMMIHWMMTIFWMIPSVVISEMIAKFFNVHRTRCRMFEKLSCGFHKLGCFLRTTLLWIISKASLICILLMTILTVASTYAILISPRLRAPDSKSFALFQPSHPFERYHSDFTESFWFEKHQKSSRDILPLTWVWGLKPIDSRDLLNPNSKPNGSLLVFDKTFDISKPKAQLFLRRFCRQLKSQPFYKSVLGPLLQNCFLESLISYMNRKCYDSIDQLDRKPCCETSKFPYAPKTFAICLERAMKDLHNTPAQFFMPTLAGPKFDMRIKGNVSVAKAVVIQYDSSREFSLSFQQMNSFFREVESWTTSMLKTAPNSMKGGFFTSDLQFYDLQNKLMTESVTSVIFAATACSIVLYLSTCNLIITLLAAFSVYTILASSLAFLALLGWRLNVLESLAVTMAAGLSVDFVLHYAIKYNGHLDREQRIKHLIVKNLTPICVASITTIITGLMLLTSEVLAFNQIGIFIIDLTVHSFCISNFGFLSLLYRFGPSFKTDWEFCQKLCTVAEFQDEINVTSQAPLSDSNSVTLTGLAPMGPELHELENMSPTFLEDPNQRDHIFDTVLAGAGTRQTCNIRRPSCTTMEPLLQDRH